MRTSLWDQDRESGGRSQRQQPPNQCHQKFGVGTWEMEHGEVDKIVPLARDLLA